MANTCSLQAIRGGVSLEQSKQNLQSQAVILFLMVLGVGSRALHILRERESSILLSYTPAWNCFESQMVDVEV